MKNQSFFSTKIIKTKLRKEKNIYSLNNKEKLAEVKKEYYQQKKNI